MIVAITGRKRHGKTTAARYLEAEHGFTSVALADPLRAMLATIDPLIPVSDDGCAVRLSALLDEYGWEGIKDADPEVSLEIRRLLQRAGTEWGRSIMDGCLWLMAMEHHLDRHHKGWWRQNAGPRIVIPDVRFDNEAHWVRLNHGTVIQISRPELDSDDPHPSEAGISPDLIDYQVRNLGARSEMYGQLSNIIEKEISYAATL